MKFIATVVAFVATASAIKMVKYQPLYPPGTYYKDPTYVSDPFT